MGIANANGRSSILVLSVLTLVLVAGAAWMMGRLRSATTVAHAEALDARPEAAGLDVDRADSAPNIGVRFPAELLEELIHEMRLLRAELAAMSESESTRTPVAVEHSAEVEQFEQIVSRLEAVAASANTKRERLHLPSVERRTQELMDFDLTLQEARQLDQEDELSRRFFFWTQQDILDRFGVPDQIYTADDAQVRWSYDYKDREVEYDFTVKFHDGRVTAVW